MTGRHYRDPAGAGTRGRWVVGLVGHAFVLAACASRVPAAAPPPATPPAPHNEVELRVGLITGAASVEVGSVGNVVVKHANRTLYGLSRGHRVTAHAVSGAIRFGGAPTLFDTLQVEGVGRNDLVTVNDTPYRGAVRLEVRDEGLTVVNVIRLEDYLPSVVASEMGPIETTDYAALQAQAVISRTYALANLGRFDEQGFDLRAGISDQLYPGAHVESDLVRRAVRDTRGEVVLFDGRPIAAFFHSTCGPVTASPDEVFISVRPRPYLRPVSDHRPGGGFFGDIAPRFSWTVEWDGATLRDILRATVPQLGIDADVVDQVRDVWVHRTGPSGRVTEVRIRVASGDIPVFGHDIRRVLRTPDGQILGSTAVRLTVEKEGGVVTRLIAEGQGWGHGVGMCQWGAIGRARAGHDYRSILLTYFPGASVARWY